jgi:hypothetical protein
VHGFDLPDLIRVNQLIRGRIDFAGFQAWYSDLTPDRRRALTYLLCEFAHQAGVDETIWNDALAASGLPAGDPVVQQVLSSGRDKHPMLSLYHFMVAVPESDLPTVFMLFVHLFGEAEGRVYRGESMEYCNHWWHRDLLDDRVVQDLLHDSEFYMTARKDDSRIKGRA